MRVIVSAAMSADGYIDDCRPGRLVLSSSEDWEEVYALRSRCDAILVGANTLRRDDPSLKVKSLSHQAERLARGQQEDIMRVTLTRDGGLDPSLRFFDDAGHKIIFASRTAGLSSVEHRAEIVRYDTVTANIILSELERRGVGTLLVEGGSGILQMFFGERAVDEFRLAVAPFFVGNGVRLIGGHMPGQGPMRLNEVKMLGGMAVLHYDLHSDYSLLRMAIEESLLSQPCDRAYRVGAVVLTRGGAIYKGHTHETSPENHAEEEAIAKAVVAGEDLSGATIYSSMEPCSVRRSKPVPCSEHIIRRGFARVVYAFAEPSHFVEGRGDEMLREAGVEVVCIGEMAGDVARINSHILK